MSQWCGIQTVGRVCLWGFWGREEGLESNERGAGCWWGFGGWEGGESEWGVVGFADGMGERAIETKWLSHAE